jgi:hypothetical protein
MKIVVRIKYRPARLSLSGIFFEPAIICGGRKNPDECVKITKSPKGNKENFDTLYESG